jgi:hypothetical protein
MLNKEARWIRSTIEAYFKPEDFPLLNVGSATATFRKKVQPHIHEHIFAPLEEKSLQVLHADIKTDDGVDIAGDLNDPEFRKKLRGQNVKSVLCSNLLEHLEDPHSICGSLLEVITPGGLILVTVPHSFPFHKDPIDTMLRPSVTELHSFFPGTEIISSAIADDNDNFRKSLFSNKKYFLIMAVRWCLPFYRFSEWKLMMKDLLNWNKNYAATCLLLRKK